MDKLRAVILIIHVIPFRGLIFTTNDSHCYCHAK